MLKVANTALVLIDVQGKLATLMHERDELFRNLEILIRGADTLELPILWLEQYPQGLGPTVPQIAALMGTRTPVAKTCFSACGSDEFRRQLHACGRRQLLLAGIEAHICVYQTARHLLAEGFHVEVVADAVSSRTPQNRSIGIDEMVRAGARLSSVEMALFELLEAAGSPQFKEIARLVK